MFNKLIAIRNWKIKIIYKYILKPIFFKFDPEKIHDYFISIGKFLGKFYITRKITGFFFRYSNPTLEQRILGIDFKNPVGLAAGFDKNAMLTDILGDVGFGFEEIGSITGEACQGNTKPRLWRLIKSKALVVYYGLKNDGCEIISKRLKNKKINIPLMVSIAKTNSKETAETEKAILDYFKAYEAFIDIGDFTVINISCPNAFGGQPFTEKEKLNALLERITSISKTKPIFIKMAPDLKQNEVDEIISLSQKFNIDGFICTNLTKDRENPEIKKKIKDTLTVEKGGISGKVVEDLSNKMIRYIYKKTNGKFIIIGTGGIFSAEDAYKKIKAGASLLQLITSMIFEGPQIISEINLGLVKLLKKDGFETISEAIGKE